MRLNRFVTLIAVSSLLTACDREPIGPDIDHPVFKVTRAEEVLEYVELGFTDFVSCANDGNGELMTWTGPYTVTVRKLTTPSGNIRTIPMIEYDDTYQMKGETSGEVWFIIPDKSRVNLVDLPKEKGNWVNHSVWLEYYQNDQGSEMFVQTTSHLTVANQDGPVDRM